MLKFLLCDDEPLMRSVLKATLKKLRPAAEFVEVGAAYDAAFAFDKESFSAVFLDMELNGGPGGLFATNMLARKHPANRIVLVTSLGPDDARVKAAVAKGTGYVQKPIRQDEISKVLEQMGI